MSIQLYYGPGACSFVPHALLEASGAAYEPMLVKLHRGEHMSEAFRALNPRSQVPVLVADGEPITQIVAIITWLDARFPELRLLPADAMQRVRVLQVLAWMNNTVHPTFTHIFLPHKFVGDESLHGELKRHNTEVYRGHLAELEAMVKAKDAAGRPFLGPDGFGPLDPYALTLLRWGTVAGINPEDYPALWAHVQKVAEVPAVARAMERERLQLNLYRAA